MEAKNRNNRGYMLVEIILASVIAFAVAAFLVGLTIKLKNRNDDTLVDTLTVTDTSITANKLMEYAVADKDGFKCEELVIDEEDGKTLKYKGEVITIFNEYANPSKDYCSPSNGNVSIVIGVDVPQMPGEDYDVKIDYKYRIDDVSYPVLKVESSNGKTWQKAADATITISDSNGLANGDYMIKYGWGLNRLACDKMAYSVNIRIDDNAHVGTASVTINEATGAGSGKGKIYVCNAKEIKDVNGNSLPSSISSDDMYLDNNQPNCVIGSVSGKITIKTMIDYDSGIESYGLTVNDTNPSYDKESVDDISRLPVYSCGKAYRGFVMDKVGNVNRCKLHNPCEPDPDPPKDKCCTEYVWTCCEASGGGGGGSGGSSSDTPVNCCDGALPGDDDPTSCYYGGGHWVC